MNEIGSLVVAAVFFLGVYIEFQGSGRRDLAIAQNAFLTIALFVVVSFWYRLGSYRWLVGSLLALVCIAATVALYAAPSPRKRSRPRLNLRK